MSIRVKSAVRHDLLANVFFAFPSLTIHSSCNHSFCICCSYCSPRYRTTCELNFCDIFVTCWKNLKTRKFRLAKNCILQYAIRRSVLRFIGGVFGHYINKYVVWGINFVSPIVVFTTASDNVTGIARQHLPVWRHSVCLHVWCRSLVWSGCSQCCQLWQHSGKLLTAFATYCARDLLRSRLTVKQSLKDRLNFKYCYIDDLYSVCAK